MRNSTLRAITASVAAVAMIVSLGTSPVLARGGGGGATQRKGARERAAWGEGQKAMSGSKLAWGTCHKSMWHTSAYHAASTSAVKTGETGAATNAAPQAGAPRFMSMQIVEGDADF